MWNAAKVATKDPMMRLTLTIFAVTLMAGCASHPALAPRPKVNLSGYPLEFRQGYADGCASVNTMRKRDEVRFKSDANYAQGWRDGYSICKSR